MKQFDEKLKYHFKKKLKKKDCGAGIGRVSKEFLLTVFEKVDLVEQNQGFLDQAKKYLFFDLRHKIKIKNKIK